MPADLRTVEVGLEVNQVGQAFPAVEGIINDVGHQPRVETGLLQGLLQTLSLGTVVVSCVVPR
ncbi:hypothetical protein GCM10010052_17640 [Paenarthrobacter histidinolovorans]|nr:hypothetical protein GCM10010052_17640 [Paenarthrobacter histidinolovorans]